MKKYRPLLLNDVRHIVKDPMLMASLLGPLLLIVTVRFLFPLLDAWIEQRNDFRLSDYSHFTVAFLLIVIPMLPGTMVGLFMLDERDENMIAYYAVTPLTRQGYISYRLYFPSLISFFLTSIFFLLSGIAELRIENIYSIILLTLEAPVIALFLAAFASNKVEGLALSKACGLLFAGPILVFFAPEPWQYIGILLPTYWPAITYTTGLSDAPLMTLVLFGIGLVYHLLLLRWLVRSFVKRMD